MTAALKRSNGCWRTKGWSFPASTFPQENGRSNGIPTCQTGFTGVCLAIADSGFSGSCGLIRNGFPVDDLRFCHPEALWGFGRKAECCRRAGRIHSLPRSGANASVKEKAAAKRMFRSGFREICGPLFFGARQQCVLRWSVFFIHRFVCSGNLYYMR